MGIPAPSGVAATGAPAANDQANAVLTGSIAAKGPTEPFAFRGPMNLLLWSDVVTTLTTTAGSLTASVASATGLAIGNAINSVNLPNGATIGNLVGTTVTLALPPNATASQVLNGADANASFTGGLITWNATLQLETSFDGCATWLRYSTRRARCVRHPTGRMDAPGKWIYPRTAAGPDRSTFRRSNPCGIPTECLF